MMGGNKAGTACSLALFAMLGPLDAKAQAEDPNQKVLAAAQCLRRIPGLIEGKSTDDITNDNAHFVVVQITRGQLAVPRTVIRFHRGVGSGLFGNIDRSRIASCMQGLGRMPTPQ